MTRIRPINTLVGGQVVGNPLPASPSPAGAIPSSGAASTPARTTPQGAPRPSNFDLSRDELARAVEAGVLDPVSTFGQVTQWPTSANNGRPYHGLNVLTLANTALEKGYPSGQWATFDGAKSKGWSVRKGEKATRVFFFQTHTRDTGEVDEETQEPILETYPRLASFAVFNVAQLEITGENQPAAPKGVISGAGATEPAVETLERIANHMGYEIQWDAKAKAAEVSDDTIRASSPSQLASVLMRVAIDEGVVSRVRKAKAEPETDEAREQLAVQKDAEKRLVQKMAEAMLSMRLGIAINGTRFDPADIHAAFAGGKQVAIRAAGMAEQAVSYMLAFDPELQDTLVEERRAMYDEILDAGGDDVVFDASTLGLDQVQHRTRQSPKP